MVTWTGPDASDNSGIVPNVTCQSASGNNFTIGTTVVKCNATDTSGNTAQCSFYVIINGMSIYYYSPYEITVGVFRMKEPRVNNCTD